MSAVGVYAGTYLRVRSHFIATSASYHPSPQKSSGVLDFKRDSNPKRGYFPRGKGFSPRSSVKDWDILKGKTWVFPLRSEPRSGGLMLQAGGARRDLSERRVGNPSFSARGFLRGVCVVSCRRLCGSRTYVYIPLAASRSLPAPVKADVFLPCLARLRLSFSA